MPFAFAVAVLLEGRIEPAWLRWSRPWTNIAWALLTLGIALGSWWAYYELGWGGWWFWDPVENASFMPWLIGVALIHSQAITDKRGSFTHWTLLLAITAFALALLGTFLVRSSVLTSVHAFAADPVRGAFILLLIFTLIGGALLLYARRAPQLTPVTMDMQQRFTPVSRETLLLLNNLLLTCACAMVLLGTLYPLLADALALGQLSVGPPYFGPLFTLLMTPLIVLLPLGPFTRWQREHPQHPRIAGPLGRTEPGCRRTGWHHHTTTPLENHAQRGRGSMGTPRNPPLPLVALAHHRIPSHPQHPGHGPGTRRNWRLPHWCAVS